MLKKKIGLTALTLILAVGVLSGCGKDSDKSADSSSSKSGTSIVAVGSSALQPLAQEAATEFMNKNKDVNITVQGGGSGMGLSQIASGSVQIGNSDIFAEAKNIDTKNLKDNKVAVVGMGPVVNKDVKVDNLTHQQLIDIFTGKVKNWKEVGGNDQAIVVINRAEGSGTRATFEQFGLDNKQPIKAQEQDNSGSVQKIISQTPGSISYLAFSYFNDMVKPLKIDGVTPDAENVKDNKWKIWSYEHMYTKKDADKNTVAFIDFVKSKDVQEGPVVKLGYIPITKMQVERDYKGDLIK